MDPRIASVIQKVEADLFRPWRIADLANETGLSKSHFSHLFKSESGWSPLEFLEQRRFDAAALLLLKADKSVKEIAHEVGFSWNSSFSHRFKAVFQCTPTGFRAHARDLNKAETNN